MSRRRRLKVSRQRRMIIAGVIASFPILWATGLWMFAASLPQPQNTYPIPRIAQTQADAIIVFTGGNNRLDSGFELLRSNYAQKLFISGVYRGVEVASLLKNFDQSRTPLCCVTVGYDAHNTYGNARESLNWLQKENIQNIILVTSSYHIPRSLYYLEKAPYELEITIFPVLSEYGRSHRWGKLPGTRALIISEYNKYIFARLQATFWGINLKPDSNETSFTPIS